MSSTLVQSSAMSSSPNSNKRKRALGDQEGGRNMKNSNTNGNSVNGDSNNNSNSLTAAQETNYAALLQGIGESMQQQDENTRTAQAALAAPLQHSQYPDVPGSFDPATMPPEFKDFGDQTLAAAAAAAQQSAAGGGQQQLAPGAQALFDARQVQNKPAVGTTAWHQLRKDNHKEVERRRREVINEGIENVAKIVPGTEKNKGAILQRTHSYILDLQNKVAGFENERALFSVTQQELTSRIDRLRDSAQRAWQETAKWQQRCRDAGLQYDDYDVGPGNELDDDQQLDPSSLGV